MSKPIRPVFYVSDGTGITAEMLGHSLLTQFEGITWTQTTIPFVSSVERAEECVARIREATRPGTARPIVFSTLIDHAVRRTLGQADAFVIDFFERFLDPLQAELGIKSSHTVGRSHSAINRNSYQRRIESVNFALAHDDGVSVRDLEQSDVILVGVSRSGKTPTCIYLALQFGVRAANYPLIPEDLERMQLPGALEAHHHKLFGLSIAPGRLREIRNERRPNSQYARLDNCRFEVQQAEALMKREGIRWVNSTVKSIEEIASTIVHEFRLERRMY